jgi:3-oxoacyl-ACP reductase-like protein
LVGLINQGATCYLNTAVQVLFMTHRFRARVSELGAAGAAAGRGTAADAAGAGASAIAAMVAAADAAAAAEAAAAGGGSAAVGADAPPPVVTKALVELFGQLRRSQDAVSTRDLTAALNWAAVDQQQDVHEFVRVLFERIEGELKKTVHKRLIEDVFQGEKTARPTWPRLCTACARGCWKSSRPRPTRPTPIAG